ncbi:MAG: exodeoxyribonuclease VII small subunit [Floccifex sp.]
MAKQLKFQEAMNRLDEIVSKLNGNNLELEEAMSLFEEGIQLSKQCDRQLKEFETKMDSLLKQEQEHDTDN